MKTRINDPTLVPFAVSILAILPISPALGSFFGINSSQLFASASIILAVALMIRGTTQKAANTIAIITCLLLLLSGLTAVYWQDTRYIYLPTLYLPSIAIAILITPQERIKTIKLLTIVAILLIAGSIVGFSYASIGLPPLAETVLKDGRPSYLFPFTLTNVYTANIIRPSAVFDEAGAFSFFICSIVSLRELYGLNRRTSLALLSGGLVTLSLAHLLFFIIFLLHTRNIKIISTIAACVFLATNFAHQTNNTELNKLLFDRLIWSSEGVSGNNRAEPFENALNQISLSNALWGIDSACMFRRDICHERYGYMGENPLSPMIFGGLFASAVYYCGLLYLAGLSVGKKHSLLLIGILLLLLQRPYIATLGYSLLFFLIAVTARAKPTKL